LRILREAAYLLDVEDPAGPDEVTVTPFGSEEGD